MTTAVGEEPRRRWWFVEKTGDSEYEIEIVAWQGTQAIAVLLEDYPEYGWSSDRPFVVMLSQLRSRVA